MHFMIGRKNLYLPSSTIIFSKFEGFHTWKRDWLASWLQVRGLYCGNKGQNIQKAIYSILSSLKKWTKKQKKNDLKLLGYLRSNFFCSVFGRFSDLQLSLAGIQTHYSVREINRLFSHKINKVVLFIPIGMFIQKYWVKQQVVCVCK